MYILGYLYTPHRANNRRKAFVCHCICGTCWWRALSKTNSCTAKQHGLAPVSEIRGCFWLRNLVGVGEEGTKGIRCTRQGADFWSSFSPHFPGPPPDVRSLFWHFYHFSCQWHWPSARGVKETIQKHYKHATSQTADLQSLNIWISKIAIYYLFVGLFLSFVIEQKPLLFPSVALTSPIPNWTSTGGWLITLVSPILTPEAIFVLSKLLEEYLWEP